MVVQPLPPPRSRATPLLPTTPPPLIVTDVAQRLGHQGARPLAVALWRRFVQQRQHPLLRGGIVAPRPPRPGRISQAVQPVLGKSLTPFRDARRAGVQCASYVPVGFSLIGQQDHLSAFD